ncbi:unnamed protein product [Ectocarpus sp. 6 AP-2014]
MLRSRSRRDMTPHLRTALALLLLASVAHTSHSFFFSPSAHPPSAPPAFSCRSRLGGPGLERRRAGGAAFLPFMAAGEGMGGGLSGVKGAGRGGGGKGKGKGKKKKKKGSKQGTLIAGPPRLEIVPEDKLDQAYVFRQERPGQTPRVIECYADRFAVVGGRRYMIGHPCDWAVSVCTPKDEGNVEAVPLDSELMEELLPGLQRELEAEDVHLFVTPITLTLQGDFLDDDEEEDEEEEDEEEEDEEEEEMEYSSNKGTAFIGDEEIEYEVLEEGDGSYPTEEEEEEEDVRVPTDITAEGVELIASYWYEDKEYALVKHLDPVFVIARQTKNGYYLLGEEEAAAVKPKVEAMLLEEIHLNEALEETLGKEQLEKELDAALEAQGGENADLSKAFPVPEEELKESEIQDAEMA